MGSVINLEPDETRFSVYLRLSDGFWKMKKIRNGCRVAGDHCREVSAFQAERDCVLGKQFNDSFDVHRSYRQVGIAICSYDIMSFNVNNGRFLFSLSHGENLYTFLSPG